MVVTFDDGYRSVMDLALPILARLEIPGTIFVPTDYIEERRPLAWSGTEHWLGGPYARELDPLSWAELGTLRRSGWEIGSHTRSHPRLTQIDDQGLQRELAGSRAICESRLETSCPALAYPYGDFDERVVTAAGRAGYEAAVTLPRMLLGASRLEWPRVGVYHADATWRFALKASRSSRAMRASSLWGRLRP